MRLTRFGQFLRSTSLDELPELWNVVKGDMSLVGPRPLLMKYLPLYTSEQARRHDVRPGVTGWAQVNGRNNADWHEKLAMDTWYVDNVSFALDLKILVRTVVGGVRAARDQRRGPRDSAGVHRLEADRGLLARSERLRWHTNDGLAGGHVLGDDRPRSHDRALTDGYHGVARPLACRWSRVHRWSPPPRGSPPARG